MARRRFGVSIDEELAEKLDRLAEKAGMDRSRVVEEALRVFLGDHDHMSFEHECSGVIVASCPDPSGGQEASEEFRDIVRSVIHSHAGGACIEILVVSGDSTRIARLYSTLASRGCRPRFVPVHPG